MLNSILKLFQRKRGKGLPPPGVEVRAVFNFPIYRSVYTGIYYPAEKALITRWANGVESSVSGFYDHKTGFIADPKLIRSWERV